MELKELVKQITDKKNAEKLVKETITEKYNEKIKIKPLTDKERLDRIEKLLGIK